MLRSLAAGCVVAVRCPLPAGTFGRLRNRESSRARLTVAWLEREVGRIPVAQAARFFGRDTSTMINGVKKLEADMELDRGLRQKLRRLREKLGKPEGITP